jgi:membrane-associated phospholipid phosphatase
VLVALVVGLDRLMLGVHTLTEVVAGYALGVGISLLTAYFFNPAVRLDPVAVDSRRE